MMRTLRRFELVAMLAIVTLMASPALAQGRGGQGRGGFGGADQIERSSLTSRDMQVMADVVVLDDAQAEIARALFNVYATAQRAIVEKAREQNEFLREEMRFAREAGEGFDPSQFERIQRENDAFRQQSEALKAQLIKDVRALLSEEQKERWPAFERAMRRTQLLPAGQLSGESVNLFVVVEQIELSEVDRPAVEELLAEYDLQLDYALTRREATLQGGESLRNLFREVFTGDSDLDDVERELSRQQNIRTVVRDLNMQFGRAIGLAITDPEAAAAFDEAFRKASYPRVYNETWGQRVFAVTFSMEDLTNDQLVRIEQLGVQFEREIARRNRTLERIVQVEEPKELERRIAGWEARMTGERTRQDDPIDTAFEERDEYEIEVVARLREVLTEDQRKALPARPRNDRGGNNARGGGRGGNFGAGRGGGGDRGGRRGGG